MANIIGFFRHLFYYPYCLYLTKNKEFYYKREKFEDRNVLESIIFPYILAYHNPKSVLDVGREDYQVFYNNFFKGKELWTLDKDPKKKEFGAKNHVVGDASDLSKYFRKNHFDLVIMNGVFGWGLNKRKDIEKSFDSVHKILKKGGLFILGWNDVPDLTPVHLETLKSLKKFKKYHFKPLKSHSFKCETGEHTYNFYIKL